MVAIGYVLIASMAAMWLGLAFLRLRGTASMVQVLLTAMISALLCYLLQKVGQGNAFFWCQAATCLLSASFMRLWRRCRWGTITHVFLIAHSAMCVFWIPLRMQSDNSLAAYALGVTVIAIFVALNCILKNHFPEQDWQDAFREDSQENKNPRIQWMYLIPAGMCLLLSAACLLLRPESILSVGLLLLLATAVYWLGVCLLVIINDYEKERTFLLAEQQYRGEMQSFLNVIRSQRHDYNFHVQTIAGLIRQNKMEDCLRYINALEEDVAIMNAVLPIRDPAISALIHNFRLMAVRQGTELHVDIHYDLSQIATNVYETNKIISNLLQNAIDEVSTHEDKSPGIDLVILKRGEYCVIRVSNKLKDALSKDDLENIYKQGYTTKQGHDGVGLSSLKTLVGRYRGVIYTQIEGDEIQFIVRVPINYAKDPTEE